MSRAMNQDRRQDRHAITLVMIRSESCSARKAARGIVAAGLVALAAHERAAGSPRDIPCCEPHESTGCEDSWCVSQVCPADPFCCEERWDSACVLLARAVCSNLCTVPDGPFDLAFGILPSGQSPLPGAFSAFGDLLAVGFPDVTGPAGTGQGAVGVYRIEENGHLSLEATLVAPDGMANDRFGFAVSLRNGSLLVGAPYHDPSGLPDAGAAYFFERQASGNWSFIRKISPGNRASGDRFGHAVGTIRQGFIQFVFGAPGRDLPVGPDAGAFYLEVCCNQQLEIHTTPSPAAGDQFGFAIATRAHPLGFGPASFAVTAPFSNHPFPDAGAVHTYFNGGSFYLGVYHGPAANSRMGTTIAGTHAIAINFFGLAFGGFAAGCPTADVDGISGRGRVEVFGAPNFGIASLTSDSDDADQNFGQSLSWWGNRLVIQSIGASARGKLSVFRYCTMPSSGAPARAPFLIEASFEVPRWERSYQISGPVSIRDDQIFFNAGTGRGTSRLDLFPLACSPAGDPGTDTDGDGVADCTDLDDDQDGMPDPTDGCPQDPWKVHPGCLGCGVPEPDADSDRIPDCVDNCPTVANVTQGDCDGNGFGDACTIADGLDTDFDGNGLPDDCDCLPDLDRSGAIDAIDLAMIIAAYGSATPGPADINRDGSADGSDLARVLAAWGDCP